VKDTSKVSWSVAWKKNFTTDGAVTRIEKSYLNQELQQKINREILAEFQNMISKRTEFQKKNQQKRTFLTEFQTESFHTSNDSVSFHSIQRTRSVPKLCLCAVRELSDSCSVL